METIDISFDLTSTDYDCTLGFEVNYKDKLILDIDHVTNKTPVSFTLDAEEGEQVLTFIMKNKLLNDTVVDENNNIIKDACLNISNFNIEYVELGHTFYEHTIYQHDFNGSQSLVEEKFYGDMGCNGSVLFKFSTPIYHWLITNM